MKADYWHEKWKTNDIAFNQSQVNVLLQRYFNQLNLKPGARILVPLCGKSIDMLWLVQQGYEVIGVELSHIACETFFSDNNLVVKVYQDSGFTVFQSEKITLFCGDFFKLNQKMIGKIEGVYDRAALIALPAHMRKPYVEHLVSLFEKEVPMLLITTAYSQDNMQGPPFSVDEQTVGALFGDFCHIKQCYNQPIKAIPSHLHDKGLIRGNEQAYCLMFHAR